MNIRKPGKILVADDEELNRILLRDMLASLDYESELAVNGRDTLEKLNAGIDLVLLDVMMPDMDGFEVARRIRANEAYCDIPIVMVTALTDKEDRLMSVEAGANDFIAKPVDITELRVRTASLLRIKAGRDTVRRYQRELEEMVGNLRKLSSAIEQSADHIIITDSRGLIEYVNPAFEQGTGYSRGEVTGKTPAILSSGRHDSTFYEGFWKMILTGETYHGIMINRKKSREIYYEEKTVTPIRDEKGVITHFVSAGRDITMQKLRSETTGLPNKIFFTERIENALGRSRRRKNHRFSVLRIDIDNFNIINNSYGYAAGDELLHLFARRMEEAVKPEELLAHLGADDFGLLLKSDGDAGYAVRTAENLQNALARPFIIKGDEVFLTASIGIEMGSAACISSEHILRNAEIALGRAVSRGASSYMLYDEAMLSSMTESFHTQRNLRKALERDEFVLYYQPIVSLASGAVVSFESLIRWNQPGKGMTMPSEFIRISEESGLIIPIGEWVLRAACTHARRCHDRGHPGIKVAVNISAQQFRKENLPSVIEGILKETELDPAFLKLEITESTAAADPEAAVVILRKLKDLGVTLLIDDFGTGYSNLGYLKRFPIDILKIDRSFVEDIPLDQDSVSIAKIIIAMARNFNIEVLAEGVETVEQLNFFREEGCDMVQGYLISKPVPVERCEDLLVRKTLI